MVRGTNPRIRIRTNISRIHNTALRLLNFELNAVPDTDPVFQSTVIRIPGASQINADPCGQDPQPYASVSMSRRAAKSQIVGKLLQQRTLYTVLRIRDVYPGSRIPDPDFYPSRIPDLGFRIPDPKTATKERDEKKLVVIPFYVATNFTKL